MTDLSQQNPYGYPPQSAQFIGQSMPQGIVYPPPQQAPIGYPPEASSPYPPSYGVPEPTYISNQPVYVAGGMSDVPLKGAHDSGFEEQGGFPEDAHYVTQTDLPSVITCSDVVNWYKEAWHMFIENWVPYLIVSVIFTIVLYGNFLSDDLAPGWVSSMFSVGWIPTFPLYYGYFIAGARVYKEKELQMRSSQTPVGEIKPELMDFLRGYLLFCPLLGLEIVVSLCVGLGLLLLIVPGLYLLVTLSFVPFVYIEYHKQSAYEATQQEVVSYGFCECISHCRRVIHSHFWEITLFLIFQLALSFLGMITVLGFIVLFPVCSLAFVPAFRDLFRFQLHRSVDDRCYCCCD